MIKAIIRFSAENRFLVLLATAVAVALRRLHAAAHPGRRDPRSLRHAGHRLLALGPQPRHHRGPGHLPDRHRAARRAEREGDPRLLRLRLLATSTSSSRTAPTSTGRAAACSSTSPRSSRCCPQGVKTELGPDATGVGWVFQYALVDDSGTHSPGRAAHASRTGTCATGCSRVPGVAEVASFGGFVQQYQVTVDPNRLQGLRPLDHGRQPTPSARSNNEVGGRLLEFSGREYMVRGRGYVRVEGRPRDRSCSRPTRAARPVLLRDVARGRARARDPPRRRRPRRPGRRGRRHRGDAPRRERAQRDRAG